MQDDADAVYGVDVQEVEVRPGFVDVVASDAASVSSNHLSSPFDPDSDISDTDIPDLVSEDAESDDCVPGMIDTSSSDGDNTRGFSRRSDSSFDSDDDSFFHGCVPRNGVS